MAYKDPEKQREYQREWQRKKRASQVKASPGRTLNPEEIRTAQGLRDLLSEVISEVREAEGDTFVKARLVGYLVSIGIKAVETADHEERLSNLEDKLNLE